MSRRAPLAGRLGLGLALAAGPLVPPASAQSGPVDVEVVNRTFQPLEVEIYDVVCQQLAYTGQLLDNASVAVAACANQDGLATLTVSDRFGHSRTYSGLADPSTVSVEFD